MDDILEVGKEDSGFQISDVDNVNSSVGEGSLMKSDNQPNPELSEKEPHSIKEDGPSTVDDQQSGQPKNKSETKTLKEPSSHSMAVGDDSETISRQTSVDQLVCDTPLSVINQESRNATSQRKRERKKSIRKSVQFTLPSKLADSISGLIQRRPTGRRAKSKMLPSGLPSNEAKGEGDQISDVAAAESDHGSSLAEVDSKSTGDYKNLKTSDEVEENGDGLLAAEESRPKRSPKVKRNPTGRNVRKALPMRSNKHRQKPRSKFEVAGDVSEQLLSKTP